MLNDTAVGYNEGVQVGSLGPKVYSSPVAAAAGSTSQQHRRINIGGAGRAPVGPGWPYITPGNPLCATKLGMYVRLYLLTPSTASPLA